MGLEYRDVRRDCFRFDAKALNNPILNVRRSEAKVESSKAVTNHYHSRTDPPAESSSPWVPTSISKVMMIPGPESFMFLPRCFQ